VEFVERLAQALSDAAAREITLTREEITAVLKLAREVAHRTDDRTNAPVAAYLAGKLAAVRDPASGAAAIGEALALAEELLPPA
jgi:uncharacterized protein DUF6457